MENPEIKRVVVPKVLRNDMVFNGEPLASQSSRKPDDLSWTVIEVYRVHPHRRRENPSNKHVGKFMVIITPKTGIGDDEEDITYVICSSPDEVFDALVQPTCEGGMLSYLARKALNELALNEPENFYKYIEEK